MLSLDKIIESNWMAEVDRDGYFKQFYIPKKAICHIFISGEEWYLRDELYPKLKKRALRKIRKLCKDAILG